MPRDVYSRLRHFATNNNPNKISTKGIPKRGCFNNGKHRDWTTEAKEIEGLGP